jgi:hypothetical protein
MPSVQHELYLVQLSTSGCASDAQFTHGPTYILSSAWVFTKHDFSQSLNVFGLYSGFYVSPHTVALLSLFALKPGFHLQNTPTKGGEKEIMVTEWGILPKFLLLPCRLHSRLLHHFALRFLENLCATQAFWTSLERKESEKARRGDRETFLRSCLDNSYW